MNSNLPAPILQVPIAKPENNFPFTDAEYTVIIANLEPIGSTPDATEDKGDA
jgi:hypothetical protein